MGTDSRAKCTGTAGLTGFDMFRQRNALDSIYARDTDTIMNARTTGEAVLGLLHPSQTWTIIEGLSQEGSYRARRTAGPRRGGPALLAADDASGATCRNPTTDRHPPEPAMPMTMPQGLALEPLVANIRRLLDLGARMYMNLTQWRSSG